MIVETIKKHLGFDAQPMSDAICIAVLKWMYAMEKKDPKNDPGWPKLKALRGEALKARVEQILKIKSGRKLEEDRIKVWEAKVMGVIALYRVCQMRELFGVPVPASALLVLSINGRDFKKIAYTEAKARLVVTKFSDLFGLEDNAPLDEGEKFDVLWKVFGKGSIAKAHSAFVDAIHQLCNKELEGEMHQTEEEPLRILREKWASFIMTEYLAYLWDKVGEKDPSLVDVKYILSLASFIERRLDGWLKGDTVQAVTLNLFTVEHQEALKLFQRLK